MTRSLLLILALGLAGCGTDLFAPYCEDLGIYPTCTKVSGAWICPRAGEKVCNDGGYETHYDCKDQGGTLCKVR